VSRPQAAAADATRYGQAPQLRLLLLLSLYSQFDGDYKLIISN